MAASDCLYKEVLSHFSRVGLLVTLWSDSPPGSSVHGSLQARVLEWVAIPFSRASSRPRDGTQVSCGACRAGGFSAAEPQGKSQGKEEELANQQMRETDQKLVGGWRGWEMVRGKVARGVVDKILLKNSSWYHYCWEADTHKTQSLHIHSTNFLSVYFASHTCF